jgi:hypothetical protein
MNPGDFALQPERSLPHLREDGCLFFFQPTDCMESIR